MSNHTNPKDAIQKEREWRLILVSIALILGFAIYARADLVYGRVYEPGGNFPREGTFKLINNQNNHEYTVKTDSERSYSIVIPPGVYRVEFIAADNMKWEAEIRSVTEPIKQDIYLRRAR